ncbi:S8 family serine peptidase [Variovorax sp. LjRoot175]
MATHGPSGTPAHPYLDWAIATNFAHLRPGDWLPLLVEFDLQQMPRTRFIALTWLDARLKNDVWIPELFKQLPAQLNFCVLFIRKSKADDVVRNASWRGTILRAEMGPPGDLVELAQLPIASIEAEDADCEWMLRLVVAVIDEGISFAHPRFRKTSNQTRVEFVWRQDAGIEITAAQIDAAVAAAKAAGENEDKVYRAIGGLDMSVEGYKPLARRHSHGTHVLDLASGYDMSPSLTRPLIIGVDMPEDAVGDPAGSTLIVHAAMGLLYVWLRAMSMRRPNETLLVVVNISYGTHEGPHDGSSVFERFMDAVIALSRSRHTPIRVVLAAGNFRQSRAHARFDLPAGATQVLAWRLQPCGLTPSFMEIWFQAGTNVTVTLTSPSGAKLVHSPTSIPNPGVDPSGFSISYVAPGTALSCFLLTTPPTAEDPWATIPHMVVPSGIWEVKLTNGSGASVPVDAWIKRGDTLGGRRARGRQSYFDDRAYVRHELYGQPKEFDIPPAGSYSYVQRQGTLSGIATGSSTYVIGAYRRGSKPTDQMPAAYSSEGPASPIPGRTMKAPNWLAPSEDAFSCPGALGAGTRSGARVAMNGTSAAAPQLTRFFAETWTGTVSGPVPPLLFPVSTRVPSADRPLVAGDGLVPLKPPYGRVWKDRP